jgi:hypothetical protein
MAATALLLLMSPARAVPPLVSGDVPTADKGRAEVYLGFQQREAGDIERSVPADEFVLGVSPWQEVTVELPYRSLSPSHGEPRRGPGDAVLGTKVMFLRETPSRPGAAISFETKLDNGDSRKGLGSGAVEYDVRLRAQKTRGRFTVLGNLGWTFVGEPMIDGRRQERRDVWFLGFAQMLQVGPGTSLLSEVYRQNSDTPGEPSILAADVGFKHDLLSWLQVHATAGKSLREGNRGGPRLRLYAGLKLEFPVVPGGR